MVIFENMRNFVEKLRALPEFKKKIIFFTVIIIAILVLGFFEIVITKNNIAKIQDSISSANFPKLDLQDAAPPPASISDAINALNSISANADSSNAQVSDVSALTIVDNPQTSDSSAKALATEDWKTYTSNTHGFEIQYPNSWFVGNIVRADGSEDIYISSVDPNYNIASMEFQGEALDINVSKASIGNSLLDEIKNRFGNKGIDFTKESIKIGDMDGFTITTICQGVGCGAPEWVLIKNNHFYDIGSGLDSTNQRAIFDQMISTFKFTK